MNSSGRCLLIMSAMLAATACAGHTPDSPEWAVSSPAELCDDPKLGKQDFCMPAGRIERALIHGDYTILDAVQSSGGLTNPYKLQLRLGDGSVISTKFKRAPDDLDSFNNSPRREVAAYQIQKLFLDESDYVVPPTVLVCLPRAEYEQLMPDVEPHEGASCAIGVLAYWIEGISSDDVLDQNAWKTDPVYRESLGNLNALTILIGHQDSIGANFYRAEDPARSRVFSVDNGLAFGAMGINPVQLFSSDWSTARVDALPFNTVERLRRLPPKAFDALRVLVQLELDPATSQYVIVSPTEPIDPNEGVRREGSVIQFGLTAEEITDVNVRLVQLLGEIGAGEVKKDEPSTDHDDDD